MQDQILLFHTVWWNDPGDIPADDLSGLVAEHLLGSRIPAQDDPVQVLGKNGVLGGFHNRGQKLLGFRVLLPRRFDAGLKLGRAARGVWARFMASAIQLIRTHEKRKVARPNQSAGSEMTH